MKWAHRSRFSSDGSAYVLSDLDPVFILLGIMQARTDSDRFVSLGDILHPDDGGETEGLHHLGDVKDIEARLKSICDYKEVPGYGSVFRLNKQLAISWLEKKVGMTASFLHLFPELTANQVNRVISELEAIAASAQSGKRALESDERLQISRTRDALSIVSAYLGEELETEMTNLFKARVPEESFAYAEAVDLRVTKRGEDYLDREDSKEKKKQAPGSGKANKPGATAGAKSLAKASTKGMSKLTSFFKKS